VTVDIPFGVEKRDLNNEPYGKLTENAIDNIERMWKGLFYAKSWVNFELTKSNVSFIADSTGHYYIYNDKENTVSTILTRTFDLNKSSDWVKGIHSYSECIGKNNFKYSLYIHNPDDEGMIPVTRLAKEKAMKLETHAVFGKYSFEKVAKEKTFFNIDCPSAIVTTIYKERESFIIRLYEGSGKSSRLKVGTFSEIKTVTLVDFLGNYVDSGLMTVSDGNRLFETTLRPWEIVNFKVEFV